MGMRKEKGKHENQKRKYKIKKKVGDKEGERWV
jgi:hypothetical protein